MFYYVSIKHERLYRGLVSIKKRDMSKSGHIVHRNNRTTVKHIYRRKKRAKPTKRSSNKAHERTPRSCSPPTPKPAANARLPDNNQNPKILRSLLRPQHHIPTLRNPREEGPSHQHLEHGHRKTAKGIQLNKRGTKPVNLYRRITQPNLQENKHNRERRRHHSISHPNRHEAFS